MRSLTDIFCFLMPPLKSKCTWEPAPCTGHFPSSPPQPHPYLIFLPHFSTTASYNPLPNLAPLSPHTCGLCPPYADLPGTGLPSCRGKNNFWLCHLKPGWSPGFSHYFWYWEIPCISTHFVTIFYIPYNTPIGLSHCWLQEQTMEQQERPCDVLVQL